MLVDQIVNFLPATVGFRALVVYTLTTIVPSFFIKTRNISFSKLEESRIIY